MDEIIFGTILVTCNRRQFLASFDYVCIFYFQNKQTKTHPDQGWDLLISDPNLLIRANYEFRKTKDDECESVVVDKERRIGSELCRL